MRVVAAKFVTGLAILFATLASSVYADQLRLGISPEPYMPFTQINQAGEWEGFEADLSQALCDKMGAECTISQTAWEGLIPALTAGKVDFIVGAFSITEKRKEVVDFSHPYFFDAVTVLAGMKSDKSVITDKKNESGDGMVLDTQSLKGKIIGFQSGTIQAAYADKYLKEIETKAYPGADTALADLTAGRIDYVLMDLEPVKTFLANEGRADYEVKHPVPANPALGEGIGYAVLKGDIKTLDKINTALDALKADGSLDAMIQKWHVGH